MSGPCGYTLACSLSPSPILLFCVLSTVLLLNPVEVEAEFLAVADKLSAPEHSPHSAYTTLLLHAFQATFGAHCDLPGLHCQLQVGIWGPDQALLRGQAFSPPHLCCHLWCALTSLNPRVLAVVRGHSRVTTWEVGLGPEV